MATYSQATVRDAPRPVPIPDDAPDWFKSWAEAYNKELILWTREAQNAIAKLSSQIYELTKNTV